VIATSVAYDVVFLVHILTAVAMIIVFLTMRFAGEAVARGASAEVQHSRFPGRRNWAARLLHVLPITGLVLSLSGDSSDSLARPWVGVGLLVYVLAAGHLEARTLPQERLLAATIARDGTAPTTEGRAFVVSMDILLALVGVALVSMLVQY